MTTITKRPDGGEQNHDKAYMPSYGKLPWDQLGRDVMEAVCGSRSDYEFGAGYPGHEITGINFNSLARIVDKYRLATPTNESPAPSWPQNCVCCHGPLDGNHQCPICDTQPSTETLSAPLSEQKYEDWTCRHCDGDNGCPKCHGKGYFDADEDMPPEQGEAVAWQRRILIGDIWSKWHDATPEQVLFIQREIEAGEADVQLRPLYTHAAPKPPAVTGEEQRPAPQAEDGWHDVKLGLPDFDQPVICTDGTRYWLDVRKDYMPELTCSGHIATHWWPYGMLITKKGAKS